MFPEGLEDTPFTIKMTLLSLEQLFRGVFVIAVPLINIFSTLKKNNFNIVKSQV